MDRSGGTGKAESFSAKMANYYLFIQLDVGRAFPENISLNPETPKCFILCLFVSNKKINKVWQTSLCT